MGESESSLTSREGVDGGVVDVLREERWASDVGCGMWDVGTEPERGLFPAFSTSDIRHPTSLCAPRAMPVLPAPSAITKAGIPARRATCRPYDWSVAPGRMRWRKTIWACSSPDGHCACWRREGQAICAGETVFEVGGARGSGWRRECGGSTPGRKRPSRRPGSENPSSRAYLRLRSASRRRARYSTIAHARDGPSSVLVPRPTSSKITRLCPVRVVEDVRCLQSSRP